MPKRTHKKGNEPNNPLNTLFKNRKKNPPPKSSTTPNWRLKKQTRDKAFKIWEGQSILPRLREIKEKVVESVKKDNRNYKYLAGHHAIKPINV